MTQLIQEAFAVGMAQVPKEIEDFVNYLGAIQPHTSMEIGSKLGGTLYILCELSKGRVISVDLPGGEFGGWMLNKHPYLGDVYKLRNDYFLQRYDHLSMITGDSHSDETLDKVKHELDGSSLDLLFIDGDHTYEGVKQDYEIYKKFVRPGGCIVFHDIVDSENHRDIGCNVAQLWNELSGTKIEFNANKHWGGIGVLINE